eukprot:COSAG01_NODE_19272_length_1020_cov_1.123779_2_plen_167_part_01
MGARADFGSRIGGVLSSGSTHFSLLSDSITATLTGLASERTGIDTDLDFDSSGSTGGGGAGAHGGGGGGRQYQCSGGWVNGDVASYFLLLTLAMPAMTVLGARQNPSVTANTLVVSAPAPALLLLLSLLRHRLLLALSVVVLLLLLLMLLLLLLLLFLPLLLVLPLL